MKATEITTDHIAVSNTYQLEALIRVLVRKGLVSEDEILCELQMLQAEQSMNSDEHPEA